MNLMPRIFRSANVETRRLPPALRWPMSGMGRMVSNIFSAGGQDAGVRVDEDNALTASAVYGCVNVISSAIATLPVHVIGREQGRKRPEHQAYRLLHDEPNDEMTAPMFYETLLVNLLLWGNGYAFIERNGAGRPVGLWPIPSRHIQPERINGRLMYRHAFAARRLLPDSVLHVGNMPLDGIGGVSPIQQARQSIGLSLAAEKFAARLFSNGANLGGIIETPPMDPQAVENFVASWKRSYSGPDNALKTAVLPDGMKYHQTGIDPEKAQMLDTRVHQVREIARIFRVPLHKLADTEHGSSYASVEQAELAFRYDTIQPWTVKLERELNRKLFLESEQAAYEVKFKLDAHMRATTKARYEAHNLALQGGWMSRNEIRALEDLPPIDGGDKLLRPLNMAPEGEQTPPEDESRSTSEDREATIPTEAKSKLLAEAAERFLLKQGNAVKRAAKKHDGRPAEFRAWAEQFFAGHEPLVANALTTPLRFASARWSAEEYAADHCRRSADLAADAFEEGTLDNLLSKWTDTGGADVARELMTPEASQQPKSGAEA